MPSTATITESTTAAAAAAPHKLNLLGQSPPSSPKVATNTHSGTSTHATPPADYPYAKFLPSYDPGLKLPPLEPFEHVDPGHAALLDANPRSFLDGAKETSLTPKFGSEIEGIQLSQLDARAKG